MRQTLISISILFLFANSSTIAAGQDKTLILVRHAEKADATSTDPELSDAGKQRAERLMSIVKKYKPGAVYSTDFKRTRDTAAPMAARRSLQVQTYDAKKP